MKRIALYIITAVVLLSVIFSGCTPSTTTAPSNESNIEDIEILADSCIKSGDYFSDLFMDESAAFWYGYCGAAIGSLRLAVEKILWLLGEGENFAQLSEGSRFVEFSELERLSPASPYTWYFEGLIYDLQGMKDEAEAAYTGAKALPNYPEDGLNFSFLRYMDISDLYKLRDNLREKENELYGKFQPELTPLPADPVLGRTDYLLSYIIVYTGEEKYEEALPFARELVRLAPFEATNWTTAILTALGAHDIASAGIWLREGLGYHPEDETLLGLKTAMYEAFEADQE